MIPVYLQQRRISHLEGLERGVVVAEDATGMMETVFVGVGEWLKLSLALFDDDDETDSCRVDSSYRFMETSGLSKRKSLTLRLSRC